MLFQKCSERLAPEQSLRSDGVRSMFPTCPLFSGPLVRAIRRSRKVAVVFVLSVVMFGYAPQAQALKGHVMHGRHHRQSGDAYGGQQPIAGSHIYLFAVSINGYGSAPISLLQGAGVSLDSSGNGYIVSGADGGFSISNLYVTNCPTPQSTVYLQIFGGDPGDGSNNPLIDLVSVMPYSCSQLPTAPEVNVNELTTVAAAWALLRYATVSTSSFASSSDNSQGLQAAATYANNLVSGFFATVNGTAYNGALNVPVATINTVGDILAECVNSGPGAPACTQLLAAATPPGGTAPGDTFQAALDIALNPSQNVSNLFYLVPANAPFEPTLSAAPANWDITYGVSSTVPAIKSVITIDHTQVSNSDQLNFPVLISTVGVNQPFANVTISGGHVQNGNGYDIFFTSDPAGRDMLDFEIDNYNSTTGLAAFWVRIPYLSHAADINIYVWYGIAGITSSLENKLGVWSNNYLSVYHLGNGTVVGTADSAIGGYTLSGSAVAAAGEIGGAASFSGDPTVYLYHDNVPLYPSGVSPVTLEAWELGASGTDMMGYGFPTTGNRVALQPFIYNFSLDMGGISSQVLTEAPPEDWHQLVGVYDGGQVTPTTTQEYVDGQSRAVYANFPGTPNITTNEFKIGGYPYVTGCCGLTGVVDEVRISAGPRSADWIATEYANQASPQTFSSFGQPTYPGASAPTISWPSPAPIAYGTALSTIQLDAAASVPGSFSYTPALGTVLGVGTQTLSVTFTPTDSVDYTSVSDTTTIVVNLGGTTGTTTLYAYSITNGSLVNGTVVPGSTSGYDGVGNVLNYVDSVNGTWSNLGYDGLNRLSLATQTPVNGQSQGFCWNYDSFGNRLLQQVTSGAPSSPAGQTCTPNGSLYSNIVEAYGANNQITTSNSSGLSIPPMYDLVSAGNITFDGNNSYLYDAEGRICAVGNGTTWIGYLYDAGGTRVAKGNINGPSCDLTANGFAATATYLLGQNNEQVTEFGASGQWVHTNVSVGGMLLATYDAQGAHFHITDWLGSRRVQSNAFGQLEQSWSNLPFGEFVPNNVSVALGVTEQHFTGKERDAESGLDYFGKRYYGSSMGRWTSPDLVNVTEERMMNPSSTLNKYVYAGNNPFKYVDPDGQDITYFYDQSGIAGHAVLFAYNQANGNSAIESFGPASKSFGYRAAEIVSSVPGTSMFDMNVPQSADDLRKTYASVTIQTTPELTQQVIDYMKANPDPSRWDFMGPNCSSEVWKILKQFKLDRQGFHGNQGITPNVLWTNMMARYNPSQAIWGQMTKPTNGRDYGNPRFDMFNLMWNSLPQSHEKVTVTIKTTDGQVVQ
jgi:RHS repeat-associated protein